MDPNIQKRLAVFGQRALSTAETVRNSYEMAERCIKENIPGDFVECGVFCGTQVAAMALANQVGGAGRKVHLFDSFEGIPQPGPEDGADIRACLDTGKRDGPGLLVSTGISASGMEAVKAHMTEWSIDAGQLVYHKGWFQDTLPTDVSQLFDRGIALLRLDGDLYESTKVCLRYLHPLVAEGGYVIVDDYALTGCRKAVQEYGDSLRHHLEADHRIADDNGFAKINTIAGGNGGVWYRKDWQ